MSKYGEKIILFITDLLMVHTSFFFWCRLRISLGFFAQTTFWGVFQVSLLLFGFWFLIFVFFGLYRFHHTHSRIDELISVVKAASFGVFLIFLITFDTDKDLERPLALSRMMILSYWGMMIVSVGLGRMILRTIHRKLLEAGIGRRKTVIVGWGLKSRDLYNRVKAFPALGYEVVGFVTPGDTAVEGSYKKIPVLGSSNQLNQIILQQGIQEVLISLPRRSDRQMELIISQCDGTQAGIKVVPELYDLLMGQVRTNQIYGFPLIEILPELMEPWERVVKRLLDLLFSLFILVLFLPFGLLFAIAIVLDSAGPIFYTQKRVGKDGKIFKIYKFRSMVQEAEKITGPVWAKSNDTRITRIGRVLRKLRLDEIPQFINILFGDMSLVGPRPERPHFVEKLKKEFPLYTRRLRVRPGLTGWAQVKGEYDQSLEHVKKKIAYDLFYLENMSLRMDLKIVLSTLYVMLRGKGH